MLAPTRLRRPVLAMAALSALAPALGGCVTDTTASLQPAYPSDYRDRHPIVLAQGARVLDLFPDARGGLSSRQADDLAAFVADARRSGSGALVAQVPAGTADGAATGAALSRVRAAAGGRVAVSPYSPTDPTVASPIRLSFRQLQAKVGSECGLWPMDLGVSDFAFSESNQQYWNLGCATQSNFAAQIADPVDLVRGRQMTKPDTVRRMGNIEKLRGGTDPSTQYKNEGTSVRSGVSQ